jgi:RNA polymerase sigma-70 factor (ECF subfamily)
MVEVESSFIEQLRRGDDAAYEKLVREHSRRMLSVARRMLRNEDDARDAVQEAFVNAFRGLEHFDGQARLSTWLYHIVVNACLMRLRTRRRKPEAPIGELLPRFYEDGHRVDPGPAWRCIDAEAAEDRELCERVRGAIDNLPTIYREALLLRDIEGLDTNEAAATLGIAREALKMRVHRGRQALRTLLDPFYTDLTEQLQ